MSINGPRFDNMNSRVPNAVGIKKYQQIKKVMEVFDPKIEEVNKLQPQKIDFRIK